MEEKCFSLLYIEKNILDEEIPILDDYEVLKSIYPDEIKEINNNQDTLYFLLKLTYEIEINKSTMDLLHNMNLDDLLNCKNDNCLYLPYWIKILYSKKNKSIKILCYVYWFKYEENIKRELEEKLSGKVDEPILYNIIEESKNIIEKSLKDKKILDELLTEIGKLMEMQVYKTIDNLLLFQTKANDDIIEDFGYDEIKFSYSSINNTNKNKHKKNENKQLNDKMKENMNVINNNNENKDKKEKDYNYDKFSKDENFAGETNNDGSSISRTHAIKNENYISIINKIKHKPIIIEFIFSYLRNNPLQIFKLIEIDKNLKNNINSFFISTKKSNDLSKTLNDNIYAIQIFKIYQEILFGDNICYTNIFAEYIMENNSFPSFIDFQTKYIIKKICEKDKAKNIYNDMLIYNLNNIQNQLIKNVKNIQLAYLPRINNKTKKEYYDGIYIEENIIINKNVLGQKIDVLFCIIDDNEYYKYVQSIKDNIIINNIYFIFVKGNKNINIYDAMANYLDKINVYNIKELHLGKGFFQEEKEICFKHLFYYNIPMMNLLNEDIFIYKKNFSLSKNIIIKANVDFEIFKGNKCKLLLGLSLLFDNININIDGAKVIDSRFPNQIEENSKLSQEKYIVIKIYDFSFLENEKLKEYFNDNKNISFIMLYISEKAIKNLSIKNKDNINKNIDFLIKKKDFIIYSEKSIQLLGEYNEATTKIEAINHNGLFLLEVNKNINDNQNLNNFNEYLFLFKKFNSIKYTEKYFSFIIDYNNIIIDFYESYQYRENDNLYIEKINKSNRVIKYLKPNINSIYFVNYYYDEITFDNNIKNIFTINITDELINGFKNENGVIESGNIIYDSNSNNLEDILNYIKTKKIKKKNKQQKK